MLATGGIAVEKCGTCKGLSKETSRSLCAPCLNCNLQKACESVAALSTVASRFCQGGAWRTLFPGMPKAVLVPSNNLEKGRPPSAPVCSNRTSLPGVPRAVLAPEISKKGHDATFSSCRATPDGDITAPQSRVRTPYPSCGVRTFSMEPEGETALLGDASKDSAAPNSRSTVRRRGERRSQEVELADEDVARARVKEGGEQETQTSSGDKLEKWHLFKIQKNLTLMIPNFPDDTPSRPGHCRPSVVPSGEQQQVELAVEDVAKARVKEGGEQETHKSSGDKAEKWHLFQLEKKLTVKIPNSPVDMFDSPVDVPIIPVAMPSRPGHCRPLVAPSGGQRNAPLPARKNGHFRAAGQPGQVRKTFIKPDANAEAELMMRLLSDTIPVVLPREVRLAPISPPSPPGDPLWKRRYIPCPKSLKVQVTSICVN